MRCKVPGDQVIEEVAAIRAESSEPVPSHLYPWTTALVSYQHVFTPSFIPECSFLMYSMVGGGGEEIGTLQVPLRPSGWAVFAVRAGLSNDERLAYTPPRHVGAD